MTISTIQNGDSGLVARSKINDNFQSLPIPFATVSDMVSTSGLQVGDVAQVTNYSATCLSGPLTFVAVPLATAPADGGSYIDGSGVQWEQQFPTEVTAESFGLGGASGSEAQRLNRACAYVASQGGGTVTFNGYATLTSQVTIPVGVILKGCLEYPTSWNIGQAVYGTTFTSSSPIAFLMQAGSSMVGCCIARDGVSYPQTAAEAAAWTNTAISCTGAGTTVEDCMIYGFDMGVSYPGGTARCHMNNVFMDCSSGVYIDTSVDVDRLTGVHLWPFLSSEPIDVARTGTGIEITGKGGWSRLETCFVFGHPIGYDFNGTSDISMDNCAVDGKVVLNNIGVLVQGDASGTKINNCNFGGEYDYAIQINTGANLAARNAVSIVGCKMNGAAALSQIQIVAAGKVTIVGNQIIGGDIGIEVTADMGVEIAATGNLLDSHTTAPLKNAAAGYTTNNIVWDFSNSVVSTLSADMWANAIDQVLVLDSAATLEVKPNYPIILVTGVANVTDIQKGFPGQTVTFQAQTGFTFVNGGNIRTKAVANVVLAADECVTFRCSGSYWYEV